MRPDFYQMFAESKGVPAGWKWHGWSTNSDEVPNGFLKLKGCVPSGVYIRGPRKGRPNFSKPVEGTRRVLFIDLQELDAFVDEWEKSTGSCRHCGGTGLEWAGWNRETGTKYRPCGCGRTPAAEQGEMFANEETVEK